MRRRSRSSALFNIFRHLLALLEQWLCILLSWPSSDVGSCPCISNCDGRTSLHAWKTAYRRASLNRNQARRKVCKFLASSLRRWHNINGDDGSNSRCQPFRYVFVGCGMDSNNHLLGPERLCPTTRASVLETFVTDIKSIPYLDSEQFHNFSPQPWQVPTLS
jgi:hypothetical protein